MRPPVQLQKLEALMTAMGLRVKGPGRIYLTGGATALLHGWRPMTVDVEAMLHRDLIRRDLILELFLAIEPMLIRYPSLDPATFREVIESFCKSETGTTGDTAK